MSKVFKEWHPQMFQRRDTVPKSATSIHDLRRPSVDGRVQEAPENGEAQQLINKIDVEFIWDLEIKTRAPQRDVQELI
ncbi:hypothetical protein CPB85DRAFT_1446114 [Mucidula mucida]|nr:hypothetical protein CPB85DRAFT_1446114 [Mucidula mucida]